jgi:hypothetical protein
MYKSNKLISRSTEENDSTNMSALLNMALGLNVVGVKVNQDFPLWCLPSIIIKNVYKLKGSLPRIWD